MSGRLRTLLLPLALVTSCALFFAYLLTRYSYDGLYGQDAYAYYYQAQALWSDITGQPQPPNARATSEGFRWPIGYHLHIIAGFLFGGTGPEGGRLLTLLLAAATPLLVYFILHQIWPDVSARARTVAGLSAGAIIMLTGTYTRFGLSLMSDVPALFWSLLALLCFLKAWPVNDLDTEAGHTDRTRWALASGVALGVAVLVRYGVVLLGGPALIYLVVRRATKSHPPPLRVEARMLVWAAAGFVAALLPQVLYYLTHTAGSGYSAFLGDWNIANIFSNRVMSADGTSTYEHTMLAFYLLGPLADADSSSGLLSRFYLPAIVLGAWTLFRERRWPVIALLASWWLVPVFIFSGTPYQSHRFVLVYLPALAIAAGIGIATALRMVLAWLNQDRGRERTIAALVAGGVLLSMCVGAVQGWRGVNQWVNIHAAFKEDESRVVKLAREAAGGSSPRVVSFGTTAALYYYTRWPIIDFYNADERQIESFFREPGTRLVVLPEESMNTQWAGTPSGARWEWIREHYDLQLEGKAGSYSVYKVQNRP